MSTPVPSERVPAALVPLALVPTALCIDVEPDLAIPPPGDRGPWRGFEQMAAVVDEVRDRITDRTGRRFDPIWCLRMDRQIERVYGNADHVVRRHSDLVGRLVDSDSVGVHIHPYRWDDDGTTYSEYADPTWSAECNTDAIGAFVDCFGRLPDLTRQGGYFLPSEALAVVERHGIGFDMTAEPGRPPLRADPSFGHHASAPSSDWRLTPTRSYRPAREDPTRAAAGHDASDVTIVPLSAARVHPPTRPRLRRVAHRLLRGRPGLMPLNPWRSWGDARAYWDLVDRLLRRGEIDHVALAVRTDDPASASFRQVLAVLRALADHPLAARLDVGSPGEVFGPVATDDDGAGTDVRDGVVAAAHTRRQRSRR